jgi:SAM-dependent methyltransferase
MTTPTPAEAPTAPAEPISQFAHRAVPSLAVTGLARTPALADPAYVDYVARLRRIDMGRHPTLLRDGLGHWSRTWEYPFAVHGVLDFVTAQGLTAATALDSGCGFTPVPFILAALGCHVTGVDLDPALPPQWDGYALPGAATSGTATFRTGDMERLPFPDGAFDVGYSVSALEHTADPAKAVAELCRVVRPGGLVLITCDVEPQNIGIPYDKFAALLAVLDDHTTLRYPPRWCHPSEALMFHTRPRPAPATALHAAYARARRAVRDLWYETSGKVETVMAIYGTARIKS